MTPRSRILRTGVAWEAPLKRGERARTRSATHIPFVRNLTARSPGNAPALAAPPSSNAVAGIAQITLSEMEPSVTGVSTTRAPSRVVLRAEPSHGHVVERRLGRLPHSRVHRVNGCPGLQIFGVWSSAAATPRPYRMRPQFRQQHAICTQNGGGRFRTKTLVNQASLLANSAARRCAGYIIGRPFYTQDAHRNIRGTNCYTGVNQRKSLYRRV